LVGVDAARALALIGMMAVHMLPAEDPDGSASLAYLIASGRSSALFAVLAGVGLALATGGTGAPRGRMWLAHGAAAWGRAFVLVLVGLVLGSLDSGVAVILVNYGMLFAVGALFLGLAPRALMILGGLWMAAGPVISHWWRASLPPSSGQIPGFESLWDPVRLLREIALTGYYPVFTWLAYLLVGLAVGRLALTGAGIARRLLLSGLTMAVVAPFVSALVLVRFGGQEVVGDLPVQFFGVTPTASWWYLAVPTPHSGTSFDLVHTTGVALAVLGGCLLLARAAGWTVGWLAGAGGMTLTIYTLHVAALAAGWGLDRPGRALAVHVVAALALGYCWRRWVGRGPLEGAAATVAGIAREAVLAGSAPVSPTKG
jgi:uncharacterized membrane protein